MPSILLLTSLPQPAPDETAALVPAILAARGWRVHLACIDDLALDADGVNVLADGRRLPLAACDLVWVLGFGRAATFLDKMQLLAGAPVRFVNGIEALLLHHAKYPLANEDSTFPQPQTHASTDAEALLATARAGGGRWVAKPPAGSFGRGVTIADADSARLEEALRALTAQGRYALLQRYCASTGDGEHRVLVAGGEIIGTYARTIDRADAPSNLAAGGEARAAQADPQRDALARGAARALLTRGICFAGLDIVGACILEANIINPGGVATLQALGDLHVGERLVDAILQARG